MSSHQIGPPEPGLCFQPPLLPHQPSDAEDLFLSLGAFVRKMDILQDGPGRLLQDSQKLGVGEDRAGPRAGRKGSVTAAGLLTGPARAEHLRSGRSIGPRSSSEGGCARPRVAHGLSEERRWQEGLAHIL